MSTKEKIQEEVDVLEKEVNQHEIVLYNDDVHTFEIVLSPFISLLSNRYRWYFFDWIATISAALINKFHFFCCICYKIASSKRSLINIAIIIKGVGYDITLLLAL